MVLNYVILGLIFFAGLFLVLASALNAKFLFGEAVDNDPMVKTYQEKRKIPGVKRSRSAYLVIGIVIIILGFVAIFTGFMDEPIKFE